MVDGQASPVGKQTERRFPAGSVQLDVESGEKKGGSLRGRQCKSGETDVGDQCRCGRRLGFGVRKEPVLCVVWAQGRVIGPDHTDTPSEMEALQAACLGLISVGLDPEAELAIKDKGKAVTKISQNPHDSLIINDLMALHGFQTLFRFTRMDVVSSSLSVGCSLGG